MHYLYFVAVDKNEETSAMNKTELISHAEDVLNSNSFANSDGGFWSCSKSDWFVMGGRWSGYLKNLLNRKLAKQIEKKYPHAYEMQNRFFQDEELQKELKDENSEVYKVNKIWKEKTGNDYYIDTYKGSTEDVELITEELLKELKRQKWGEKKSFNDTEICVLCDGSIDDEYFMKDFIKRDDIVDKYYLVIVDYHS